MDQDFNKYFLPNQPYSSKVYNTNQSHPLIPSSQEYLFYKKYVSIHSEDRDIIKYPNASFFEIELPEDLLNVSTISLANWSFPENYDVFSQVNSNITMTFQINNPFKFEDVEDPNYYYYYAIFSALFVNLGYNYTIEIETGCYNSDQIVCELNKKFNYVVTQKIIQFLEDTTTPSYDPLYTQYLHKFITDGGYTNFKIVFNEVSQKIWFGNICDGFMLTNETQINKNNSEMNCYTRNQLPNFSNWGLPFNLGLPRNNIQSVNGSTIDNPQNFETDKGVITPRFYYGDVYPCDNGFWLLPKPELTGSLVNWIESPYKINLTGPSYFYIELDGQNCIDETMPYNLSTFTVQTNQTNGIVNSSFAKIIIPSSQATPMWFDRVSFPYKEYNPPAERIRKLKIKIRYHNGQLVDFGNYDYSLLLEFVVLQPTPTRTYTNAFKKPNMLTK
jgi:hypothetical protein